MEVQGLGSSLKEEKSQNEVLNMAEEKKGEMSVKDAGRKGGEKTSQAHGKEFYENIGHKGGQKTSQAHGKDFYEDIGHKGGERTSRSHGKEFYQEIGHKGGQRVRELIKEGKKTEEG